MRLLEFVSADDLVKLWQIVSQNVFAAVEKERREAIEAQRLAASKPKRNRAVRSPSRSVSVPKTVRPKAVKPKAVKPQVAKTQATTPQSLSKQQSPQMSQAARLQMQTQPKAQQLMLPKTTSVQPTQRNTQVAQPIRQQQQLTQANIKLNPN